MNNLLQIITLALLLLGFSYLEHYSDKISAQQEFLQALISAKECPSLDLTLQRLPDGDFEIMVGTNSAEVQTTTVNWVK